ncbi:MAG: OmpA family protein [Myxococcales bacterium]|nr:OmpA family protein [Myxococcales bacterium]
MKKPLNYRRVDPPFERPRRHARGARGQSRRCAQGLALAGLGGVVAFSASLAFPVSRALASPSAGVDVALFRSSYDTGGVFSLEGARLMPKRDISWKMLLSYAKSPVNVAVPGIGGSADTSADPILDYLAVIDMAFAMSISDRFSIGLDVAAFRTDPGVGYGTRGLYGGSGLSAPSTGLVALRPLSNIDQAGSPVDDGRAGPLDVRLGGKLALLRGERAALTLVGTMTLPFGEDEMLLGDSGLTFEPKLAFDFRLDRVRATKVVLNVGARLRKRTVLQSYDAAMETAAAAKAFLDVGSEALVGAGFLYELSPRIVLGAEATAFIPLPDSTSLGACRLSGSRSCDELTDADYFGDASRGDLSVLANGGVQIRINEQVSGSIMAGAGPVGARGDDFRVTTGIVWSPQPGGGTGIGRADVDDDGVPDAADACVGEVEDRDGFQDDDGCPDVDNDNDGTNDNQDKCIDEPEDRDGFQDADGCPEQDNDGDQVNDTADRCPDQKEDIDGFDDADGCPDEDNDLDGFADAGDKCPNDPETVNGIDDEDGCPDARGVGPEDRGDRLDLKGGQVTFRGAALSPMGKQTLRNVAVLMRDRSLSVRVEVHVPLGTRSRRPRDLTRQKAQDKFLSIKRATAVLEYLASQGVPLSQIQAAGLGSDRPLGNNAPTDPANERVDFIKAQQRSP